MDGKNKKNENKIYYEIEVKQGQSYSFCACGLSKEMPICDGAHKGTGMKSHKYTAAKTGKITFCHNTNDNTGEVNE